MKIKSRSLQIIENIINLAEAQTKTVVNDNYFMRVMNISGHHSRCLRVPRPENWAEVEVSCHTYAIRVLQASMDVGDVV